jgi:aldehyde:ferredoxin oxidoreductase
MLAALTGLDEDIPRLRQRAAAIATLTRRFNIREGLTPEDDRLPRQLHRHLEDSDLVVTEEEIDTMVQDYYRLRGWDQNGIP